MIYKYIMTGIVHNTDRRISYEVSAPLGITVQDLCERLDAFCKAFIFTNLKVN